MAEEEVKYMMRALQLACCGAGYVSPNPMVGAVITEGGEIIGEGYHRRFGGPHAEVNAVRSVSENNRRRLRDATIYVTLEPCSHYGKTPPCANLLVECGFRRVVIATLDPNPKVAGRGKRILEDAGIEVVTGCLEREAQELNRRFFTAHLLKRPYITLKWAQSADGFIAGEDPEGGYVPHAFSTPLSLIWMHRERAMADAIMVGTNTVNIDNPSLTLRCHPGRHNPMPVTFDVHGNLKPGRQILSCPECLVFREKMPLREEMALLYRDHGITSLLVEGGTRLLTSFIEDSLYDEIRVEVSPEKLGKGCRAPRLPETLPSETEKIGENRVYLFVKNL